MKREIKFRVWDHKLCVMYSPDNQIGGLWSIKEAPNGIIKYEDGILMQYTGLKDKYDKEIYEGDIVKFVSLEKFGEQGSNITTEVEYIEELTGFTPMCHHVVVEDGFYNYEVTDIEVIGNIKQNPELL